MKQTMQIEFNSMRLLAGACGLFAVLALAPAGVAQQAVAASAAAVPAHHAAVSAMGAPLAEYSTGALPLQELAAPGSKKDESVKSDGSLNQGIKVHGHWEINVKNPDGKLVEHRDFENSLVSSAPLFLVGLMSGYMVPGDYMIALGAQSGAGPCNGGVFQWCGLVRSTTTHPASDYCSDYYCVPGLMTAFNLSGTGAPAYSIVLSGTIAVNNTGTIGSVYTLLNTCANVPFSATALPTSTSTITPGACVTSTTNDWVGPLTGTNVPSPIAVTSGQLVQVTVTISFS